MDSSLTGPPSDTPESPAPSRKSPRRRLAAAAVAVGALLLTGCQLPTFGGYKGATTQARSTFHLWQGFFIAGIIVGGFTLLLIMWAVFRYRRRKRDADTMPVQTQYHTLTEIIYTVVPILIVLGLFVATVVVENKVTAVEPNPVRTGSTCTPSSGAGSSSTPTASRSSARPPTRRPWSSPPARRSGSRSTPTTCCTASTCPSSTSAATPAPGYSTYFDFNVLHDGVYRGQCTQLCGLYHSLMFFNVRSVSPSAYQTWLRATGAFQRAHPNSIGQLPADLHANVKRDGAQLLWQLGQLRQLGQREHRQHRRCALR